MSDIADQIEQTALGPKRVTVDGTTVEAQSIDEQIAADKHVAASAASTKNHLGLFFRQFKPGGTG